MLEQIILTQQEVNEVKQLQNDRVNWISFQEALEIYKGWTPGSKNFITRATGTASKPQDGLIVEFI